MFTGQVADCYMPVLLDISLNGSDEVSCAPGLPLTLAPVVDQHNALLDALNYLINLGSLEGRVRIHSLEHLHNLFVAFSGLGKSPQQSYATWS